MGLLDALGSLGTKNVALVVLTVTTIALSIALGVTVSEFNEQRLRYSQYGQPPPQEYIAIDTTTSTTAGATASGKDEVIQDSTTAATTGQTPAAEDEDQDVLFGAPLQFSENENSQSAERAMVTIDLSSSATISCPTTAASSQAFTVADLVNPAALGITLSATNQLCTLVRLNTAASPSNTFIQPLARSYSGNDWEKTRGAFVQQVAFDCTPGTSCTIDMTKIEAVAAGSQYQLSTFDPPAHYTKRDVIARFLEQTTFGPTTADIDALEAAEPSTDLDALKQSLALATYVQEQQATNSIFSHRAHYRKHLNARFEHAGPMGRITWPCERGTRYRRMAFSDKDDEKTLVVTSSGTTKLFAIDGKVRTAYDPPLYGILSGGVITEVWYPDGDYRICEIKYDLFTALSSVTVKHPDHADCITLVTKGADGYFYSNLPINVHPGSNDVMINIPIGSAAPIDVNYANAQPALVENQLNSPEQPEIILSADLTDEVCFELRGGRGDECTPTGTEPCKKIRCMAPPPGCFNVESHFVVTDEGFCCPGPCYQVDSLGNRCNGDEKAVIAQWNGQLYIHDPRRYMLENTLEAPKQDGGGEIETDYNNPLGDEWTARCANAKRNFVNEDSCFLSNSPDACSYRPTQTVVNEQDPYSWFNVTLEALKKVYQQTGAGAGGNTVYLYAIDGLRVEDDIKVAPPCQKGRHRFIKGPCTTPGEGPLGPLEASTIDLFERKLASRDNVNENPFYMDWYRGANTDPCDPLDSLAVAFEIRNTNMDGTCFKHVHPDHLNVYDFTYWTISHPGNSETRNPIKELHESGNAILTFPDWHGMDRWQQQKGAAKPGNMRLGESYDFYRLPLAIRRVDVAGALGVRLNYQPHDEDIPGPFMVCGSPFEVANDPFQGGDSYMGAFDADTSFYQTTKGTYLKSQLRITWFVAALSQTGQLRQRVAWALSQIFSISPDAIISGDTLSEAFLVYYDIFVRQAFGNYRDVMKEVSFSPIMGEMLTYYGGRSTATVFEDEGNIQFADENYAREVMQLFSLGLYRLNKDGTQQLDGSGGTQLVYTNDDIEEYARAWTGFIRQGRRGNIEEMAKLNQIDPMQIFAPWRDRLPKMGLDRTSDPELHTDPVEWRGDGTAVRLTLDPASQLFTKLISLVPQLRIVLDANLDCTGIECSIDTVRVVKVGDYYYEYIRTPCVLHAFFGNAKTIARRANGNDAMCGDPNNVETATTACCETSNSWNEQYFGERTVFATSQGRCSLCDLSTRPSCTANECLADNYYWTEESCMVKAKINPSSGKVGVVHEPTGVATDDVASIVQPHTQTYFRVDWTCGDASACGLSACEVLPSCSMTTDGMCLCEVSVADEPVFGIATPPTREQVLDLLHIGAVKPFGIDARVLPSDPDVKVYYGDTSFTESSIFEVVDDYGRTVLRKNVRSVVSVAGTTTLSFRNPVHFMHLADPEPRDAYHETDATLDHYFYHPNTGPFVAYRFAQRFGISNPSPRYVTSITDAFVTGLYTFNAGVTSVNFGSGKYGDLASTIAAVLLDREARDFILDMDLSYGSVKEPIIKITGLLRSLGFNLNDLFKWVEFQFDIGETLGQMAHEIPSVFSFFLPEYQPSGPVSQAALVAPEAQVLSAPTIINTMNGILSALKYGLNNCVSGFGPTAFQMSRFCSSATIGSTVGVGGFGFTPSSTDAAVDELATLMTAGRLSPEKRTKLKSLYDSPIESQMLISSTPEFHATGVTQTTGVSRPPKPAATASSTPYKALVYVFLPGAYDSWNTLVPHTCTVTNSAGQTPREQYENERSALKLVDSERTRIIDATGQPCSQFAVHPDMEFLERNYNGGDLAFFANVGQIDTPVTKDDYQRLSRSQLFAHNSMQQENYKIDPWDAKTGTGLLGRTCDALQLKGFKPQPITVTHVNVATVGVPGASEPPLVVGLNGVDSFARARGTDGIDLNDHWSDMNNATEAHSSAFGETWSINFKRAVEDSGQLKTALDNVALTQNYPDAEGAARNMIRNVKTMASMILTHEERGVDRDVMFARVGTWDHHARMKTELKENFVGLDQALSIFESEMKAQNLWANVTVAVVSEFGRTLTANSGDGSDHAWGGHYWLVGGSVKGGQILGDYPPDITSLGPVNIGRGRIMPTSSWESMLTAPLQWLGLETEAELDYCMPNRLNAGAALFTADQVFKP
ncbi:Protein of unknown function (DUF1800) [Seminavis robusta]|uniref:Uncharacterized protein n=1 Tax=Seminavis robusta TaxID=568900 RepID=A0A9N8D7Z3_9STRA|nr:Protein of unknown function (DUF1800) [Seminavis robusta]|eukprot:Sro11_g008410.1 Protein of unknown function (DUF1800) (2179) ;mRNA; r:8083-16135